MGIKLKFSSITHLKTNGQVEKANGLQRNKEEVASTTGESQARLGR
jgi:hypothetical protein